MNFTLLFIITVTFVNVKSGVVEKNGDFESFCLVNPSHSRCEINNEKNNHPDLPDNSAFMRFSDLEVSQIYWTKLARDRVKANSERKLNTNTAKNIILFLGDGMGVATVTAARMLLGDENEELSFEKFPYTGSVKTYCLDAQVADSSCSATAFLSGVKGNYGTQGVDGTTPRYGCGPTDNNPSNTPSIAKWAQDKGFRTGLVTNTRLTHATPAAVYSHISNRDWEYDCVHLKDCDAGEMEDNYSGCNTTVVKDIAHQLIHNEVGRNLNVILGGGRRNFIGKSMTDEYGVRGYRNDGRNLYEEWLENGKANQKLVNNRDEFMEVDVDTTDYLLGVFGTGSHLADHWIKDPNEPTLWEMIDKALNILSKDDSPFFLFVEGGKIDMGHHGTYTKITLDETIDFHEAVQKTRDRFSEEDTLIVVTADHSHTMTISGYPDRGHDILGTTGSKASDGLQYFTLNYANTPFGQQHLEPGVGRVDPLSLDASSWHFTYPGLVWLDTESHGGDDVAVYASGPWSHLFTGTLEQNVIPHFMAYAACIGDGLTKCSIKSE